MIILLFGQTQWLSSQVQELVQVKLQTESTTICPGDMVVFNALVTNGGTNPTVIWFLNGEKQKLIQSLSWSTTKIEDQDLVWVQVIAGPDAPKPGSTSISELSMKVLEPPSLPAGENYLINEGSYVILSPNLEYPRYLWSDGSTSPRLVVNEPGFYGLKVTNEAGCSSSTVFKVFEKKRDVDNRIEKITANLNGNSFDQPAIENDFEMENAPVIAESVITTESLSPGIQQLQFTAFQDNGLMNYYNLNFILLSENTVKAERQVVEYQLADRRLKPEPTMPIQNSEFVLQSTDKTSGPYGNYLRVKDSDGHWSFYTPLRWGIRSAIRPALAQSAYFFNVNHGSGSGSYVGMEDSEENLLNINTDQLDDGIHRFYLNVKNEDNTWGIYRSVPVFIRKDPPVIDLVEVFYDQDPGVGQGILLPVQAGQQVIRTINVTPVPSIGTHLVYIRARDNYGAWGDYRKHAFFQKHKPVVKHSDTWNLVIDRKPYHQFSGSGSEISLNLKDIQVGKHTISAIPVGYASNHGSVNSFFFLKPEKRKTFPVSMVQLMVDQPGKPSIVILKEGNEGEINLADQDLKPGFQMVRMKAMDSDGNWSIYRPHQLFIKNSASLLVKAEMYLHKDKTPFVVASFQGNSKVQQQTSLKSSELKAGHYQALLRVQDHDGHWSNWQSENFMVRPRKVSTKLILAEYFIDQDPGLGSATKINTSAGGSLVQPFLVSVNDLDAGQHKLFLRVKSDRNIWSQYRFFDFEISLLTDLVQNKKLHLAVFPNPGNGLFLISGLDFHEQIRIGVFDTQGRKINFKQHWTENNQLELELSNQPAGIYLIEISSPDTAPFFHKYQLNR